MPITKIETPKEFLEHVVTPDVTDFRGCSTDLRAAYHACTSLLSLRDWVCEQYKRTSWAYKGNTKTPFINITALQNALNALDNSFAIVTDIANASKHMILDPRRSQTNLWGAANTEVKTTPGAISSAPISAGPISGSASRIVVKIDQNSHDVRNCVDSVHDIWRELFVENAW